MPDNPTNPEKAASEVKPTPDTGKSMTAEVNEAMSRNSVNTRAADQRLSAALEQKGVLPALILEGLAAGGSGRREDLATVAAATQTRPGDGASTVAAIGALAKFDEIDGNHDGSITPGEVTKWQQAMQKAPEQLRYPDGSRLQHQPDGTYQIVNRDGSNDGKPIDAANVRPDGSVVQEKAESGEATKVKSADGSTITLAKQTDGSFHATRVVSATGTTLNIEYHADGSKSVTENRITYGVPGAIYVGRRGDKVDVDDATGSIKITTKAGRYTERDSDSTLRTYDHAPGSGRENTPRLLNMTNSDGTSTTYNYNDAGAFTSISRPNLHTPPGSILSVDDKGNVTAAEATGRQTLYKTDGSSVKSEPDGHDGMRVTDVTYFRQPGQRSAPAQHFSYDANGTMTGYTDVNGLSYRSEDGQNWTARDGAKRQFEVNVASDGTTSTILLDGQGGRTVDRALTDGRGSQQNLAAPESAVAATPATSARPAAPGAASSDTQPGALQSDGSQPPVDTTSGVKPGQSRVIPNANGFIEYGTGSDGTSKPTITWRDSNNVARESLQQDGNGRWTRTSTGSDGKPVNESVSQVRTYPDGGYSYQNDKGNSRVQENADGSRVALYTSPGGNTEFQMDVDGKTGKIVHTSTDGKVETITPKGDGTASVQIGDQPPFNAKLDFDVVKGTYAYDDGVSRGALHNADGSHIDVFEQGENSQFGVSRPDGTRYATTYGADGKIAGVQLHINAKPDKETGDTIPERNDTWVPTGNPGELRRNDGVVATDLKWELNGDFSFTYVTDKGETVRHTDLSDGTQKNVLMPVAANPA